MENRDLVLRMLSKWFNGATCGLDDPAFIERMFDALVVAREEMLAEPSEEEMIQTARFGVNWAFGKGLDYDRVRDIFANRRARYAKPSKEELRRQIESKVTVLCSLIVGSKDHDTACDELLGLIQQLKGGAA